MKKSLYKTKEGQAKAHQSYDAAMQLWQTPWQDDWVDTAYGRTHLVLSGPEDAPPLLLLPGMFGDACMWFANAGALAASYRVLAIDNLSYAGKSQPAGRPLLSDQDYALWLAQIADHYGYGRFALAGMSYGGWMSAAISRLLPQRVAAAVLIDPAVTFQSTSREFELRGLATFLIFPSRQKTHRFFAWLGGNARSPAIDRWNEHLLDCLEYGSASIMDMPRSQVYQAGELSMLTMPILVLVAGKPVIYKNPASYVADAQRLLPNAETVLVPGTAHAMQMEKADEVNALMLDFLGRRYR